jgi:hypothetical protein
MTTQIIRLFTTTTLMLMLVTQLGCGIKNKDLKRIGTIIAVGIAAKLIYDMVIEHQTQQISNEKAVIDKYKERHKSLPAEPTLVSYESSLQPGGVVNAGSDISITSQLEVVRGAGSQTVDIQERIVIFDNEDPNKEIKSFTKPVNTETKRGGAFANEFKFKLPKGMPQGVYPIKTQVIIDGKASEPVETMMQLVDIDNRPSETLLIAAN